MWKNMVQPDSTCYRTTAARARTHTQYNTYCFSVANSGYVNMPQRTFTWTLPVLYLQG